MGELANKFPGMASTSMMNLQDFLTAPSPVLLRLHLQGSDKPQSRSAQAFEKLRDCAIENLCVALKAGVTVEPDIVYDFIASISTREKTSKERLGQSEGFMVSWNVVLALGRVAVALKDHLRITSTVLHQVIISTCGSVSVQASSIFLCDE